MRESLPCAEFERLFFANRACLTFEASMAYSNIKIAFDSATEFITLSIYRLSYTDPVGAEQP